MFGFALKNPLITSIAVDEITPHIIIIVINTCTHARTHTHRQTRHQTAPLHYTHYAKLHQKNEPNIYKHIYCFVHIIRSVHVFPDLCIPIYHRADVSKVNWHIINRSTSTSITS